MQEEKDELKKELLSRKEPELKDMENYQSNQFVKNKKVCSKKNTKDVAELSINKV